jgi:hypothetical protein
MACIFKGQLSGLICDVTALAVANPKETLRRSDNKVIRVLNL